MVKVLITAVIGLSALWGVTQTGYAEIRLKEGVTLTQVAAIVTSGSDVHYKLVLPPQSLSSGESIEVVRAEPIRDVAKESGEIWRALGAGAKLDGSPARVPDCWTNQQCPEVEVSAVTIKHITASTIDDLRNNPLIEQATFHSTIGILKDAFFFVLSRSNGRPLEP